MQNNINIKTCSCKNNSCTGSNYNGPVGMTGSHYTSPVGMSGSHYTGPVGMSGSSYNGPIGPVGMFGSNHTSIYGSYGHFGISGTNYTFIPEPIPTNYVSSYYNDKSVSYGLTGSHKINAHQMDSSNNILKPMSLNTIIKQDESFYLTKNNMYNKKLNLDKEICEYLNLKKNCSIADLKISLDKISLKNKEYLLSNSIFKNKENIPNKKSVIFLDNEGKKIFNLKSNLIDVNCLIDLIIFNFMNKVPESHFYDHNKIPKEITELSI